MTSQTRQPEFTLIRCPICEKGLFKMTPTASGFHVSIKCKGCSGRQGATVYVTVYISLEPIPLEPLEQSVIDLQAENNFASA